MQIICEPYTVRDRNYMKKAKYSSRFCIKGNRKRPACIACIFQLGAAGGSLFGGEVLREDALASPAAHIGHPLAPIFCPPSLPWVTKKSVWELGCSSGKESPLSWPTGWWRRGTSTRSRPRDHRSVHKAHSIAAAFRDL